MKITLQHIKEGPEEIIIKYREMTAEVRAVEEALKMQEQFREDKALLQGLSGTDGKQYVVPLRDVIYFESVDGATYCYLEKEVYHTGFTLAAVEENYEKDGFFRCNKSMVLNIYKIHSLKSEPGNRIDAVMENGEHVMISRRFAKELRARLKGGF